MQADPCSWVNLQDDVTGKLKNAIRLIPKLISPDGPVLSAS